MEPVWKYPEESRRVFKYSSISEEVRSARGDEVHKIERNVGGGLEEFRRRFTQEKLESRAVVFGAEKYIEREYT